MPHLIERSLTVALLACVLLPTVTRAMPVNDNCGNATPIVALPFADSDDTTLATNQPGEPLPSCAAGAVGNSVWYTYTAPGGSADTTLDIDATGTAYSAVLAVYDGPCVGLVERACYVDPSGSDSRVPVTIPAGTTVRIQVSAESGGGGPLVLEARLAPYAVTEAAAMQTVATSATLTPLSTSVGEIGRPTALTSRKIAFAATHQGIFNEIGGVITKIVATGDPTPIGGTFRTFGPPAVQIANVGGAFYATVDGVPGVTQGIFSFAGLAIATVAVQGDPAPTGGTFIRFLRTVAINFNRDVVFGADVTTGTATTGIFGLPAGGVIGALVLDSDPNPCGGTFNGFAGSEGGLDINIAGDVAFRADGSPDDGFFVRSGSVTSAVACGGAPAPGFPLATYDDLGEHIRISDASQVVFQAELDTGLQVVYAGPPGAVAAIAETGMVAVGGEVLGEIPEEILPGLNNAGDVAFRTEVVGAGNAVGLVPAGGSLAIVVAPLSSCGAGGIIRGIENQISMGQGGLFDVQVSCTSTAGIMQFAPGGAISKVAFHLDTTTVGSGFSFDRAEIDAGSDSVFRGTRTAVYGVGCTANFCTPPVVVARAGETLLGALVNNTTVSAVLTDTIGGARRPVFTVSTLGSGSGKAITVARRGGMRKVVEEGDALPGGAGGTFGRLASRDPFSGKPWRPAGSGGRGAFTAETDGVPFDRGVFAFRRNTVRGIVASGEPSPDGGVYEEFSSPAVSGRRVVFAAETSLGECVLVTKRPGVIDKVACLGDAMPVAIGGTIGDILSPPTIDRKTVTFHVEVSGGNASKCLLAAKGVLPATLEALICDGDPQPLGGTLSTFGGEPQSERNALAFTATDLNSVRSVYALRKGVLARVAADGGSAPSGGTFRVDDRLFSIRKKSVVFRSFLTGGPADQGLYVGFLP